MKKFGIICGGFSSEFDISVKSARNILKNFPDAYDAYLIYLQRDGWFIEVNGIKLSLNSIDFTFNNGVDKIDAVIVYIHGDPGENGKIQAYLDMIGLPYVNSGPLASQLSFDKWYCNEFLRGFGYSVAKSIYFSDAREVGDVEQMIEELGLPIFVKPCDSGSSYGIAKVKEVGQLSAAIEDAFAEGESVILESFLDGVEVTCGAYRTSEGIQTLPLTEIVSENDFFDYEAKYQGLSEEITPARISENSTIQVQKITKEIYQLLNLRSIARIDFILVGGIPFVIEVNTTPGFSDESIVPKMLSSASISTKGFWTEIIGAELDQ
ncbi:ATP-grasp domain-containing protein [Crocinitomicaceae bacterium]|nr:ATP-grasp domain-containing protein [Crocinitomicaceae bacterium]